MTRLVIDGSVTIAWFFADERNQAVLDVRARVIETGAVAPSFWRLEVANAFLSAQRRGRATTEQRVASLSDLDTFDIELDHEGPARAWAEIVSLADRLGLTIYDACYLDVALRRGLPLATLDHELREAAAVVGIETLGG